MLDILIVMASKVDLLMNTKKCHTLHINTKFVSPLSSRLTVPLLKLFFAYDNVKHLHKPFGFHIAPYTDQLQDYVDTGKSVLNSKLTAWQKIDALKTFLFPSFSHAMRMNIFGKEDWAYLGEQLKPLIKRKLKLPKYASNEYLYGTDSFYGLLGIPKVAADSDITKIDMAAKLLIISSYHNVSDIAWEELEAIIQQRRGIPQSSSDLQDFHSGGPLQRPELRLLQNFVQGQGCF